MAVKVGIRPILNLVASNIRQILKLTISLVLFGLLSGCGAIGSAALSGALMGAAWAPDRPPLPPEILCTAEDSIGLQYANAEGDTQHEEAMQLISEHCVDGNIETYRKDTISMSYVFAACLQADGSPPVLQTCKYVAPDPSPIGFSESY